MAASSMSEDWSILKQILIKLALLLCHVTASTSLNPLVIHGYKFFDSVTGDEVFIQGIDYYPRPNHGDLNHNSLDLFTNDYKHIWLRDILYLQQLGVNAVRLYAVNPNENHDAFMCAMEQAGIYVIVALAHDCPTCAITKDQAPICYPKELKIQGQQVINAFAKYSNTLGFSAGNEVNHFAPPNNPEWNAPCQKKFLQDMREYIASCPTLRNVPIGLISADNARTTLAEYYNCQEKNGLDEYETAEWYGLNTYVYCDGNVTEYDDALGFRSLEQEIHKLNYSIPFMLTEFGCLSDSFDDNGQRNFNQAKWISTIPALQEIVQGGFAFEYSIEMENAKHASPYPFTRFGKQNYGIGYFGPEDCDDIDIMCEYHKFPSFEHLQNAYRIAKDTRPVTTIDAFNVSMYRSGPSTCPKHFPKMDAYTWETDQVSNIQCPTPGSASNHICHAGYYYKNVAEEVFEDIEHKVTSSNTSWVFLLLTMVVVVTIVTILVIVRKRKHLLERHVGANGDIPTTILTISDGGQSDDSGSYTSNESESVGLMSMKKLNRESNATDYQAISSSDSSSSEGEEERKLPSWHR